MSDDIECQLLERIKSSPYNSIQLDESTDFTNVALLLVFVGYCVDGNVREKLPTRRTATEVILCLDTHFINKSIDWKNCVGVCTGGAAAMAGIHHGVVKQILERASQAMWTHCFLQRENLAARQMSPELHDVMSVAAKSVNYIKKNALYSRCFADIRDADMCDMWHAWQAQFRSLAALVPLWSEVALKRARS